FKQVFPDYVWKNEDEYSIWQKDKQVAKIELKTDSIRQSTIDLSALKQQLSGVYRIEIAGKNSAGDTISQTKYIQVVANTNQPQLIADWIIPLTTQVEPGGKAIFLLGTGNENHILMEVLDDEKIVSSSWFKIGRNQLKEEVTVPISAGKNFRVQFLTVKDNRLYTLVQPIKISNKSNQLDINFLSFRNLLQPGEKEQWKLQVSGDEKQSVEMLAAMYDASLDDLAPAQNWWQQTQNLNQEYDLNNFNWNSYNFVNVTESRKLFYFNYNPVLFTQQYEKLNLLGFNYYGGYNVVYDSFKRQNELKKNLTILIKESYLQSVTAFKNGYDVTGRLVSADDDLPLVGALVMIKGTKITVPTDINGNFKLRVPDKAILVFAYLGYSSQQINVEKGQSLLIK
ncbi:MAG: hypothetical protein EOP43_07585, partial [Sphingobacteriaceae bacterium]